MKLLKEIPESAMVAAFLKAEFSSIRFRDKLKAAMKTRGVTEMVITDPNLEDKRENQLRSQVLGDYRGYGQNREVFEGIPADLIWYKAELTGDEVGDLHYIDYNYWNELTNGTHRVSDGVASIDRGNIVFNVSNDRFYTLADEILSGAHVFEAIILWGKSKESVFTILEGNLRATAFGLAGKDGPRIVDVIIGLSQPSDLQP
jgi:hypothetical protein